MRPLGKYSVLSCTSWNTRYPLRNYFLISSTAFYWSLYGFKWFIEMGIFPTTCLPRLWTRRFASFCELQNNYQTLIRIYIPCRQNEMEAYDSLQNINVHLLELRYIWGSDWICHCLSSISIKVSIWFTSNFAYTFKTMFFPSSTIGWVLFFCGHLFGFAYDCSYI